MKKKNNDHLILILVLIVIIAFLVTTTSYYMLNQNKLGKRGNLIGDGVCGNFDKEEGQNFCCARAHKSNSHLECMGEWKYVAGQETCQYICQNTLPSCREDAKICPDGQSVSRNASLNCNFNSCPA